jgi:PKD repeat protein
MKKYFIFICIWSLWVYAIGQPNIGGKPFSFTSNSLSENFDKVVFQSPDKNLIQWNDSVNDKNGTLRKVGVSILVNLNLKNSGSWEVLPNGDRIWRLQIQAADALALGLYYSNFNIPHGARLYIYNPQQTQVIGAFTESNNPTCGLFATELIGGSSCILEYYEPSRCRGLSVIDIAEVAYVYRDYKVSAKDFGDSESCEVNVNCSEGTNWQNQKKGVARIFLKVGTQYAWCSGSLINDQPQDCSPYFLTADHCGESASAADLAQWVFHFNYEASGCTNPASEPTSNSITGCTFKASGGNGGATGSDFYLVRLNTQPAFNPYYNGWDRNNTASTSGVSIHHPAGDIKKISTYTSTLNTSGWNGSGLQSHWQVTWAATTNGHGVTEGGSSGGPIFNNNGLVVGDLTGGGSYCTATSAPDYYGKFSYSWDQNGTTAATRLKDWLDPNNTGVMTISGKYCSSTPSVNADFSGTPTTIPVAGTVDFTDLSTGTPTSWAWTFNGGTPATSTTQNPTAVQYNTAGVYTVSLTVGNGTSNDTETKNNYIIVGDNPPVANFIANTTSVPVGGTVNFTDLSVASPTSWLWTFTGGTPATSTLQNPSGIQYNAPGLYAVSLTATNAIGSDDEIKTNYIYVGNGSSDAFCDSLHFPFHGNYVLYSIRYPNGTYSYYSGNNGYSDKSKADFFTPAVPYTKLTGVLIRFGKATTSGSNYSVPVNIWDNSGTGGVPGSIINTKNITYQQIASDIAANHMTYVEFNPIVELTGSFYLGIDLPTTTGDTLAILTNKNGQTIPGTAWEQWRDDKWLPYSDPNSWDFDVSHAIFPILCKEGYGVNGFSPFIEEINIYPNPSNAAFTIDFGDVMENDFTVEVFNCYGQSVFLNKNQANPLQLFDINLGNLNSGIYFVSIESNGSRVMKKIQLLK